MRIPTCIRAFCCLSAIALLGCGEEAPPRRPAPPSPNTAKPSPPEPAKQPTAEPELKPDFTLTSEELVKQYAADKEAATKSYDGKVVDMPVTIRQFSEDGYHKPKFIVDQNDKVMLYVFSPDPEPWQKYVIGQRLKVRGKLHFRPSPIKQVSDDIDIISPKILEAEKAERNVFTTQQLIEECKARAGQDKYRGKCIYVRGEVMGKGGDNFKYVELKGVDGHSVRCGFDLRHAAMEPLKVGSTVTIVGEYRGNMFADTAYEVVDYCYVVEP